MTTKPFWQMPEWMRPFADHIAGTGGNDIEKLAVGRTKAMVNLPLALIEAEVQAQIGLLIRLHSRGLLRPEEVYVVYEGWPSYDSEVADPFNVIAVALTEEDAKNEIKAAIEERPHDGEPWTFSDDGLHASLPHEIKSVWADSWTLTTD